MWRMRANIGTTNHFSLFERRNTLRIPPTSPRLLILLLGLSRLSEAELVGLVLSCGLGGLVLSGVEAGGPDTFRLGGVDADATFDVAAIDPPVEFVTEGLP
jgi:hypothetical protein